MSAWGNVRDLCEELHKLQPFSERERKIIATGEFVDYDHEEHDGEVAELLKRLEGRP